MTPSRERYRVNLFRPEKEGMRDEVAIILAVLLGWGAVTFGSQVVIALCGTAASSSLSIFHLPLPFFFTAQFLPLWFIVLCLIFNIYIDRITAKHSRRKDRSYE